MFAVLSRLVANRLRLQLGNRGGPAEGQGPLSGGGVGLE
jgi:hypothetical protein